MKPFVDRLHMTGSHDNVILRRRSSPNQHPPGREAPLPEAELEHKAVFDGMLDAISRMSTAAVPSTQVEERTDVEGLIQTPEKRVTLAKKEQLIPRQPTPNPTPAKRAPVAQEGIMAVPFRQLVPPRIVQHAPASHGPLTLRLQFLERRMLFSASRYRAHSLHHALHHLRHRGLHPDPVTPLKHR
ncbi:hypothetical protein IMZ48_03280 [Candidatus Bathyarchaeota archaeon]|nr:hypothetical protein [Candidatus Bathyarchaeota archaeon]